MGVSGNPGAIQVAYWKLLVRQIRGELSELVHKDGNLAYRLFDPLGYKHYDRSSMERLSRAHSIHDEIFLVTQLTPLLTDSLIEMGFDPTTRTPVLDWLELAGKVQQRLQTLLDRSSYDYEVRIFLNGPLVSDGEDRALGSYEIEGEQIEVSICRATDEHLLPLVDYRINHSYKKVNTILRYRTKAPVEAGEPEFTRKYRDAAKVAEHFVDVLRLVRSSEDVGVLALEILPADEMTPAIRKTLADRYQLDLAPYQPVRFDFEPPLAEPLTPQEFDRISSLSRLLRSERGQFRGMKHALTRFRSSVERYRHSDPEQVLEFAMALEALYVNDPNVKSEIGYRLKVRCARFLSKTLSERNEVFRTMGVLYELRSQIAHGGSLDSSNAESAARITSVLGKSKAILALTLIRLLELPLEIATSDVSAFWRSIELDDTIDLLKKSQSTTSISN